MIRDRVESQGQQGTSIFSVVQKQPPKVATTNVKFCQLPTARMHEILIPARFQRYTAQWAQKTQEVDPPMKGWLAALLTWAAMCFENIGSWRYAVT